MKIHIVFGFQHRCSKNSGHIFQSWESPKKAHQSTLNPGRRTQRWGTQTERMWNKQGREVTTRIQRIGTKFLRPLQPDDCRVAEAESWLSNSNRFFLCIVQNPGTWPPRHSPTAPGLGFVLVVIKTGAKQKSHEQHITTMPRGISATVHHGATDWIPAFAWDERVFSVSCTTFFRLFTPPTPFSRFR